MNYLANELELSGSSSGYFYDLVDLIVKKPSLSTPVLRIQPCTVYLLERGPKVLVGLATWAQKYLTAHKKQLGRKSKTTFQPRRADQKKSTQPKQDLPQGRQRSLDCYCCQRFGHRQSDCATKISLGKDQKGSSTPMSQSS